ncbi:MAG: UDP-glucose 4-epimerase [Chloroflexi bacterium]|jgi:UDP-glucose 4-epimerase|nr:MAG: UDP-glucose 4-epimerase [Chloroflexota bacterium]
MTTLVTGATGFAGINIVRALAEAGEQVVALDTVGASDECHRYITDLEEKIDFVVGDVLDATRTLKIAKETGAQRIVHAAAITPPRDVELAMPSHIINVNLMGTVNMLDIARKISAERFVFVSSSGVYGAPKDNSQPVKEEANTQPGNLYGICKLACELLMNRYKQLFGLSTVVGRMAAIYGPMERVTASRGNPSLIYKLMHAHLEGRSISVRGGDFVSDYTHVTDASTIWRNLALADELNHDIYNVSSGVAYPLTNVLETLQGLEPTFNFSYRDSTEDVDIEIRPESERGALDLTRPITEFGFSPKYNLRDGLEAYLKWAREYPTLFPST